MTKEVMREALTRIAEGNLGEAPWQANYIAIKRIATEALAQPEQEPVAVKHMKAWVAYLKRKSDHGQHMKIPSEMSAGACWELAIELEQFINTTPPQRTWVELTDEEIDYFIVHRLTIATKNNLVALIRICEAKLKEKNT